MHEQSRFSSSASDIGWNEILSLVLKFDILWKFVYPAFSLKQTKINDEAEQHWNKSCPPQSQKRQTMPNTKAIRKRTRPITWYKTCCIRYYSIKTLWWLFTSIVINWISKNRKYICDIETGNEVSPHGERIICRIMHITKLTSLKADPGWGHG